MSISDRLWQDWQRDSDRYADEFLGEGDEIELSTRFYRGTGPHWGPAVPQRQATTVQAKNMEAGWQRLLAKARADISAKQTTNESEKMPLIAKAKAGEDFELIPEDQHLARCVLVCDIGTHDGTFGPKHQCIICWEFPEVLRVFDQEKGEEPAMLSAFYTLSLSEKANLRGLLEAWRGRAFTAEEQEGFDLEALLGVPCLLQVVHAANKADKVRAKVASVAKLHKSMTCPPQVVSSRMFALESSTYEDFTALPAWIQGKVKESAEYADWLKTTTGQVSQDTETNAGEYTEAFTEAEVDGVPF